MAAIRIKRRSPFGELLREALEETGMSIRGLARALTNGDPTETESCRRKLQRYINGEATPNQRTRDAIADALQLDRPRFAEDREHEERRRRLMAAMQPLADELLLLATQTREHHAE
jgi:transcriptional regulator with XRE-family HTH domain